MLMQTFCYNDKRFEAEMESIVEKLLVLTPHSTIFIGLHIVINSKPKCISPRLFPFPLSIKSRQSIPILFHFFSFLFRIAHLIAFRFPNYPIPIYTYYI